MIDPGGGAAALTASGLGKRYGHGRPWALRDVDLAVTPGSVTALVGPNGAGKSTLIKAWVSFERPTAGSVTVQGVDPWRDRAAALRRVGYVPQATSLYRELTVADHLDLAASLRPGFDRPAAHQRLDQLAIPLDRPAAHLSGGQAAQVGLALALGTRAPVLLLDEPLASLDPLARREFLQVVTEAVRADGTTVILSSHIITDVEQACDRLVVLGGGRALLDAPIVAAVAAHRVLADGEDAAASDHVVAMFLDAAGRPVRLVRDGGANGTDTRRASVEEIVLGYLASGRGPLAAGEAAA